TVHFERRSRARVMATAPGTVNANRLTIADKHACPYKPPMIDYRHTRSRPKHRNPTVGKNRLPRSAGPFRPEALWIYGLHPVQAALANPRRQVKRMLATPNALSRLRAADAPLTVEIEETTPRRLDQLLGGEAVHQGVAIEV